MAETDFASPDSRPRRKHRGVGLLKSLVLLLTPDSPKIEQNEELEASPLSLYGAGILFPRKAVQNLMEDASAPGQDNGDVVSDLDDVIEVDTGVRSPNASWTVLPRVSRNSFRNSRSA